MRTSIIVIVLTLSCFALAEQYTDRYDEINVYEIIKNKRLLTPYLKCLLDQGRCTPEGKELKTHVADAMQTGCKKCTQAQREKARIVVKHISENEKQYWEGIKTKYDPGDKSKNVYEAFLASED